MSDESLGSSAKIEELKEKFDRDPGSKIFLQLAEEYRKANRFGESIQVCLSGLTKNPGYTSARVTLARAYIGAKRLEEAKAEFEKVIAAVPDNLLANRFLGDLYYEEGNTPEALRRYKVVQMLNPGDDEVASRIQKLEGSSRPTARDLLARPAAPPPAVAASAPGGGADDDMSAFMDLKIDESVILNADMVAAAAAGRPPAGRTAPPPVSAPPPAVAASSPPAASVAEAAEDLGGMGMDDFSDFSSPTVFSVLITEVRLVMLTILGKAHTPTHGFCDGLSRRNFLTIGGMAMGGMAMEIGTATT